MTPCDLNLLIAAISNQLYCSMTREEFKCLSIFLNELSKSMFTTVLFEDVCKPTAPKKPPHKDSPKEGHGHKDGSKKPSKKDC